MSKDKLGETGLDEAGQEPWRAWLRGVVGSHGGVTAVARLAEVPKQTLDNYLSGRTKKPNLDYLHRIAAACAVEMTWLKQNTELPAETVGLAEPDAVPYDGPPITFPQKTPASRGRWTVRTRALDLAGILPGDVLEFEIGADPMPGDPVVAQLFDETGAAETVLRLYHPPFLVVRSSDPAVDPRPVNLDDETRRMKLLGGFVRLLRQPKGWSSHKALNGI